MNIQVTPSNATLTLNGGVEALDNNGKLSKVLSFGTYTYKVEAQGYYPKEGQVIINDENKAQSLIINDLRPITGNLFIKTNVDNPIITIDGKQVKSKDIELQIGQHSITIEASGYKSETEIVEISENATTVLNSSLSKVAKYYISSKPSGVAVWVNKEFVAKTPFTQDYTSGTYRVRAEMKGYKSFDEQIEFDSSNPLVYIQLKRLLNYKSTIYIGGTISLLQNLAYGGNIGLYLNQFNFELSYLYSNDKSDDIYWTNGIDIPQLFNYSPYMQLSAKFGYGFSIGTRFRITPQLGCRYLRLQESTKVNNPCPAANSIQVLASMKLTIGIIKHLDLSICPSYYLPVYSSKGYMALFEVSPKISSWNKGLSLNIGINTYIDL